MGEVGEVRARTEGEKKVCDLIKTGTLEERRREERKGRQWRGRGRREANQSEFICNEKN